MRIFINILSILILIGLIAGFVIKPKDDGLGDVVIGITILTGAFVLMPAFIFHQSKGKKIKDYMLTNENLKKMKDFKKEETNTRKNKE